MKKIMGIIWCVLLIGFSSLPAAAVQDTPRNIIIGQEESIQGDYFGAGDTIINSGKVNGDIYAAGSEFENGGEVTGDIILAAMNSKIGGKINGNLRLASNRTELTGEIGKNITALTESLLLAEEGAVDGNINVFASRVILNGIVGGDVRAASRRLEINGEIKGDVTASAEELYFGPNGKIQGNLTYTSEQEISIPEGAVTGHVEYRLPEPRRNRSQSMENLQKGWKYLHLIRKGVGMLAYLLIGFLSVYLFDKFMKNSAITMEEKPWHSVGIGLTALIVIPIAAVLMMFTVIGIPLGILSLILYGILLYLARLPVGLWIGRKILKNEEKSLLPMLLGLVILLLISYIPYIGRFISFAVLLFGIGTYLINIQRILKKDKPIEEL
ncbi:polymer-forming cytoskeletal protein [Geosporobacter ferrireducens]|uniref:DUF8173 domain-containing protein n=1 Tax=Geosporobacter ferrireducens TaxID=1424294 RepID=A0A1D8GGE9_9FIRM|nr:polymer-forming cytoskeletal protein [Geosporobacter ferrireducens]AOT69991.1 hypothetical protein Gferi_10575 [Geosporobacter ferrireducens]